MMRLPAIILPFALISVEVGAEQPSLRAGRNGFSPVLVRVAHNLQFSATVRNGAAYRTRTCDPIITNDVLYQLS